MIAVHCDDCRHDFEVADIKAGMGVFCPGCATRLTVPRAGEPQPAPQLVAAHTTEGRDESRRARSMDDMYAIYGQQTATATPARPPAEDPAADGDVDPWCEPAAGHGADGTRNLDARLEDDARRTNLFRIGLAMTIAFFLPIAGAPGHFLMFPQFGAFPGLNLAGLVVLLPLLAGILTMVVARRAEPPRRGVAMIVAGALMFLLMLIDSGARGAVTESFNALPGSVSFSFLLVTAGTFGLLISCRLRWYRPAHPWAYGIGAAAAGCYALYLLLPIGGGMPIVEVFSTFSVHKLLGLGALANVGLMLAAAVLCVRNLPDSLSTAASEQAGKAFRCLAGSVVVPAVLLALAAMTTFSGPGMSGMNMGSPATMLISSAVKFGVMYGGLVLLIPIGIVDLLVGRP